MIWFGDLYRLVSPYEEPRAVLMYASKNKDKAILFSYILNYRRKEYLGKVKIEGLDPDKNYRIEEINLMPEVKSALPDNGRIFSGDYLMKVGLNLSAGKVAALTSSVIEITARN